MLKKGGREFEPPNNQLHNDGGSQFTSTPLSHLAVNSRGSSVTRLFKVKTWKTSGSSDLKRLPDHGATSLYRHLLTHSLPCAHIASLVIRGRRWHVASPRAAIFSAAAAMPCSGLRSAYGWHQAHSWRQLTLPVPRSPSTQTAPSSEQTRGWISKPLPPLTPGQELFAHSSSAFPPPPPPLSFLWPSWQALPLAYTATTSFARERCHITAAKKHRHSSTFSRDRQRKGAGPSFCGPKRRRILTHNETETKTRRCQLGRGGRSRKSVITNTLKVDPLALHLSVVRSPVTQTLATPTPVKRASSSSCRRGSRLWSSSIMAADTRELIKKYVAGGLVYSSRSDGSLDSWGCDESWLFLAIWMWKIPVLTHQNV